MRVYIGCFGSGLGHASRMLEVAGELASRGGKVEFSSSGEVVSLIEARGFRCNRLPLADVSYSDSGAFQVKETLLSTFSILGKTCSQVALETGNIGRFDPDAILSDSSLATVLAGRARRIPTCTVLNQLNLTSTHQGGSALSRLFSTGMSASMGKLWELSDEVLLPDLPPPYTISERNLWGSSVEKTRYVGFLFSSDRGVPDEAAREFRADTRPKVFWQVSGPPRTRKAFLDLAFELSEALKEEYAFVISGGDPMGSASPRRFSGGWYYGWCSISDVYFGASDVVVARAGHGTVSQAIAWSRPSLLVPIPRQPEQEGNADKAAKLGVAIVLQQSRLNASSLKESIGALLTEGYKGRVSRLGDLARRQNAKVAVVEALESAVNRARPIRH